METRRSFLSKQTGKGGQSGRDRTRSLQHPRSPGRGVLAVVLLLLASLGAGNQAEALLVLVDGFTLSVATAGTGSGTVTTYPGGIGCPGDCSETYAPSTAVTLIAIPAGDSTFTGWSGAPDCTDGLVTLATDTNCTATFDALAVADPDSPVQTTTVRQVFENGCAYFVEVNVETNSFVGMTPDPATPFETVYDPDVDPRACTVTIAEEICEAETGLAFCSKVRPGQPPLQSELGGTCYYPRNIKFTC